MHFILISASKKYIKTLADGSTKQFIILCTNKKTVTSIKQKRKYLFDAINIHIGLQNVSETSSNL